jgi:transcriptional regulator with XRE-family HTH domain/GNAT superfamily N-acetyltransferase
MLRALRRRADLSQRDLAERPGVPQATVARIKSGATPNPSFRRVQTLVRAAGVGLRLDMSGTQAAQQRGLPPAPQLLESARDGGGRRYPAHLDLREVRHPGDWWGSWWVCSVVTDRWPLDEVPAVTFDRDRAARDLRRRRAARGAQAGIRRLDRSGRSWGFVAELEDGSSVAEARVHEFSTETDGAFVPSTRAVRAGAIVLEWLFVAPAWRRLGIGRRMFAAVRAETDGPVLTPAVGYGARQFLQRCGCEPTRDLFPPMWHLHRPIEPD